MGFSRRQQRCSVELALLLKCRLLSWQYGFEACSLERYRPQIYLRLRCAVLFGHGQTDYYQMASCCLSCVAMTVYMRLYHVRDLASQTSLGGCGN